jgi:hypothetical protein
MDSKNANCVKDFISEIKKINNININKTKLISALNELDNFIGLYDEKEEMITNIKGIIYRKKHNIRDTGDTTSLMAFFLGPPGSGKTELAKLWGQIVNIVINSEEEKTEESSEGFKLLEKRKKMIDMIYTIVTIVYWVLALYIVVRFLSTVINLLRGKKTTISFLNIVGLLVPLYILFALIIFLECKFNAKFNLGCCNVGNIMNMANTEQPKQNDKKEYIILNKSDLVGQYIGQTQQKTKDILRANKDKAILIDECYTLLTKSEAGGRNYGEECITAIMEFHDESPNTPIGFMGYKENTEQGMLESQPGFIRRCGMHIHFKPYNYENLYEIFLNKVKKEGLYIRGASLYNFKNSIKDHYEYLIHYGGDIKTLIGYVKDNIAKKHFNNETEQKEITFDCFKEAINKVSKINLEAKPSLIEKAKKYYAENQHRFKDLISFP